MNIREILDRRRFIGVSDVSQKEKYDKERKKTVKKE